MYYNANLVDYQYLSTHPIHGRPTTKQNVISKDDIQKIIDGSGVTPGSKGEQQVYSIIIKSLTFPSAGEMFENIVNNIQFDKDNNTKISDVKNFIETDENIKDVDNYKKLLEILDSLDYSPDQILNREELYQFLLNLFSKFDEAKFATKEYVDNIIENARKVKYRINKLSESDPNSAEFNNLVEEFYKNYIKNFANDEELQNDSIYQQMLNVINDFRSAENEEEYTTITLENFKEAIDSINKHNGSIPDAVITENNETTREVNKWFTFTLDGINYKVKQGNFALDNEGKTLITNGDLTVININEDKEEILKNNEYNITNAAFDGIDKVAGIYEITDFTLPAFLRLMTKYELVIRGDVNGAISAEESSEEQIPQRTPQNQDYETLLKILVTYICVIDMRNGLGNDPESLNIKEYLHENSSLKNYLKYLDLNIYNAITGQQIEQL